MPLTVLNDIIKQSFEDSRVQILNKAYNQSFGLETHNSKVLDLVYKSKIVVKNFLYLFINIYFFFLRKKLGFKKKTSLRVYGWGAPCSRCTRSSFLPHVRCPHRFYIQISCIVKIYHPMLPRETQEQKALKEGGQDSRASCPFGLQTGREGCHPLCF